MNRMRVIIVKVPFFRAEIYCQMHATLFFRKINFENCFRARVKEVNLTKFFRHNRRAAE